MKPHEKAKSLVQKYFDQVSDFMNWEQAKERALIVVEEVISCGFNQMHKPEYAAFMVKEKFTLHETEHDAHLTGYEMNDYWEAVKAEIEEL